MIKVAAEACREREGVDMMEKEKGFSVQIKYWTESGRLFNDGGSRWI